MKSCAQKPDIQAPSGYIDKKISTKSVQYLLSIDIVHLSLGLIKRKQLESNLT